MSQHNHDQHGNSDYYSARAIEERRLAMAAKDPNARAAHLDMAERYAALANGGEEAPVQAANDQLSA